ncbi:Trm112 family protein [Rhizobium leguminosarum]|uniref:Trm112 family protein n=1 Tax=Rhizobium leguminosarum TaxID=384 RepID=UPI00103158CD|nr:Trm112 family protein [Rhizobium leguminosarum]TBF89216.1 Trm112 family protein [Rhizobium leguminosarum]
MTPTRFCSRKTRSRRLKLLDLLVCPLSKGRLPYDREPDELVSEKARLAYPIRESIPIMLVSEARRLDD